MQHGRFCAPQAEERPNGQAAAHFTPLSLQGTCTETAAAKATRRDSPVTGMQPTQASMQLLTIQQNTN